MKQSAPASPSFLVLPLLLQAAGIQGKFFRIHCPQLACPLHILIANARHTLSLGGAQNGDRQLLSAPLGRGLAGAGVPACRTRKILRLVLSRGGLRVLPRGGKESKRRE